MAIKRVVNKPSRKVLKYPEFDSSKIYVRDWFRVNDIMQLYKVNDGFNWDYIGKSSSTNASYPTFKDALFYESSNYYILNNQQDLANFILGCREFPKLKPIEVSELADDEVSVEDVSKDKIYATVSFVDTPNIVFRNNGGYSLLWGSIQEGKSGLFDDSTLTGCLKKLFKGDHTIYQFDTQEEFFKWALEKVTGKDVFLLDKNSYNWGL